MKKILITGGAGFIGSNLCEFLQNKYQITVLDDLSNGNLNNLKGLNVEFIKGDIRDSELIEKIVSQNDYVVHLAANVSVQRSIEDPHYSRSVNIDGFLNVLESCKKCKIKKFIYASSAAIYGDNNNTPLNETEAPKPISNYGLEKLINEQYANLYKDVSSIGLRFFNVYGKNQNPNSPYSGVISKFIYAFQNDKTISVFGNGKQSRDFIHVKDVCRAVKNGLNSDFTGVLNICTEKKTNLLKLLDILKRVFNKKCKIKFLPQKSGDIFDSLGCCNQAKDNIGFEAKFDLMNGLKEFV